MARWRPAMLLVLAVALLAAAGWRADALSVTVTDTKCIHEFVPYEGDSVLVYFVVVDHGINLTVTSPGGNTVYTLKGKSGKKFEFKAPRRGMYKFCFYNPYGAPETVSVYIHVGCIPNEHNLRIDGHNLAVEEALEEDDMKKRFKQWMAMHHRTYKEEAMKKWFKEWMATYHRTYKEEAMKKRFKEWMATYHRTYKDEEEKAQRYELFKDCAKRVDMFNALPDRVTLKTSNFCDRSEEEMRPYFTGSLKER